MSRKRRQVIAVVVFLIVVLFFTLSFRMAVVHGDSMLPTFRDGQIVLVNRLRALGGPLQKGDVVVLEKDNDVLIKRIAFLPGETLLARDAYRYSERARTWFERPQKPLEKGFFRRFELKVPAGQYVVLGDNPAVSDDSRAFGPIPAEKIIGRVVNAPPKP